MNTKLELFRVYLMLKKAYYVSPEGSFPRPLVEDFEYDIFESVCRKLYPGDIDFYMVGYGEAHEQRLHDLEYHK